MRTLKQNEFPFGRRRMGFGLFTTILTGILMGCATTQPKSDEASLFKRLLEETEYDSRIKPTVRSNDQITASIFFSLNRIESLAWKDELLQWNPDTNGNTYRIIVPAESVWMPEIAMLNSVIETSDLTLDTDFRVEIFFDGTVGWSPSFLWKTSCAVDLRYFPFDEQTCHLQFINWMYQASHLNFTVANDTVNLETYTPNGEWELLSATALADSITLDAIPGVQLPLFQMTIQLKRVPTFFMLNVVMPTVLITVLSVLVYWLPYESGEKVSLGITVLLSFSIVLLMISDVTPRSGSKMPILTWYVIASMFLAGGSLVFTVGILNIYHASAKPVPNWIRSLILYQLARGLCMRTDDVEREGNSVVPFNDCDVQHRSPDSKEKNANLSAVSNPLTPPEILQYVSRIIEKETKANRLERNKDEWIRIGKVLDRACLVFFLCLVIITSVAMLPLINASS